MENTLSVEVAHDYLPEFNRMLPLPGESDFDGQDCRIARAARLRLWRQGPAEADELRPAVEAEVAECVEHGELSADEAVERIDRVCLLLSGDASIADPPDVDEVEIALERCRERFDRVHRPWDETYNCPPPPAPYPDRYGNWPGVNWRPMVEWSLGKAYDASGQKPSTSTRIAWMWLRREKLERAEQVAAQEKTARKAAVDIALSRLPIVFDDDRQTLLRHFVRLQAGGDLNVLTSGEPAVEAELLAKLLALDPLALPEHDVNDVLAELVRFVAAWAIGGPLVQTVPTVGYAIVKDGTAIVGVVPGHMRLTIEGREHVLHSPRFPRPARMSAKDFRDWKRCAQAIYDQTRVEVDFPRGHWKRWWPSLAVQLGKTAEVVEEGDQIRRWQSWLCRLMQSAPMLPHAPGDGSVYIDAKGRWFASKGWLLGKAIQDGEVGDGGVEAFSKWLPLKPDQFRFDAAGKRKKLFGLPEKIPLLVEGFVVPDEKNEVAGSTEAKTAEIQGRNSATGDLDAG
jgi:hypothetical protein